VKTRTIKVPVPIGEVVDLIGGRLIEIGHNEVMAFGPTANP